MFSNLKNSIFICLTGICLPTSVFAWEPYLNAQIGYFGDTAHYDYDRLFNVSDYNGIKGRLGFGYAKEMTKKYAIGVEYGINYYQTTYDIRSNHFYVNDYYNFEYKRISLDLLAVIFYNVTSKASLFVKMGPGFALETRIDTRDRFSKYSNEIDIYFHKNTMAGFFPKAIFGIGYDITPRVNLNLSLNKEFLTHRMTGVGSLDLGINYSFC